MILVKYEFIILSVFTAGFFFMKERTKLMWYFFILAFATIFIYSVIPYKTPWNIINMTFPIIIASAFFLNSYYLSLKRKISRGFMAFGSAAIAIIPLYQTIDINYFNYEKPEGKYSLIYVQTSSHINTILNHLDTLTHKGSVSREPASKTKKDLKIQIVMNSYWPLPWYFAKYKSVGYFGRIIDKPDGDVIMANISQRQKLEIKLRDRYIVHEYRLRHGKEKILMYVKADLVNEANKEEFQAFKAFYPLGTE